jgi:hypothetical protein
MELSEHQRLCMKFGWKQQHYLGFQTTGKVSTCSDVKKSIDLLYTTPPMRIAIRHL